MDLYTRIQKAREAGAVTRYHTARLIRGEDVAQHTFNMLNLALILTNGSVSPALFCAILAHDMGERVVGDLPSPVKNSLGPEVMTFIHDLEDSAVREVHPTLLPIALRKGELNLLTLCDNLDGLLKCMEEIRMGNSLVIPIATRYHTYIVDILDRSPQYKGIIRPILNEFRELASIHL